MGMDSCWHDVTWNDNPISLRGAYADTWRLGSVGYKGFLFDALMGIHVNALCEPE